MRPLYGSIASPEGEEAETLASLAASKSAKQNAAAPRSARSAAPVSLVRHKKPQGGGMVLGLVWGLFVLASVGVVWKVKEHEFRQSFGFVAPPLVARLAVSGTPTITASNSYSAGKQTIPGSSYPFTSDYIMVEPHRQTKLTVDAAQSGYTYTWTFTDGSTATGSSVSYKFTTVGTTTFDLTVTNADDGETVSKTTHQVLSRYVRREVRSLSGADLKAYLTAAKEVYTLKPSGGRRKYGADFTSMQELSAIYNQLASDADCNHIADGMGYMTSHAGLLLTFERSVQAVNPAVSVPYWDFTIDAENAAESGSLSTFYKSEVFGPTMFGEPSDWDATQASKMTISSGVFAKLKVRGNMWDYGLAHSPHGLARSPLNPNPSSYVTRHAMAYGTSQSAPGCAEHYTAMQTTSLEDLHTELRTRAFDAIPLIVGGVSGADLTFLSSDHGYSFVQDFARDALKAQWALYRQGLLQTSEYCVASTTSSTSSSGDTTTSSSSCKPTCTGLDFSSMAAEDAATILKEVHPLFNSDSVIDYTRSSRGENLSVTLLQSLCNGLDSLQPQMGDLYDVPVNDPLFWSSFATLDRLWHWKRINGLEDASWSASSCYGHSETDTLAGVYKGRDGGYFSNSEVFALTNPSTLVSEMSYLYDGFTWAHCAAAGIPTDLRDTPLVSGQRQKP